MRDEIAHCCKKLRLGRKIVDAYDSIQADNNHEYLLQILQLALDHRETSRKNRLVKQAGFYAMKTFEDFSFSEVKLPQELSVEELKEASFIDDKKNLILYGNVGTGNYGKKILMERNEVATNQANGCRFISFHNI